MAEEYRLLDKECGEAILKESLLPSKDIDRQLGTITAMLEEGKDYKLKTNEDLIEKIIIFGCGETDFHTADVERLIRENEFLKSKLKNYGFSKINNR